MIHTLTKLQYSKDRRGPWKLYIFEPNSPYHRGGVWFGHDDSLLSPADAEQRTLKAIAEHREVRICDGGDELVFHAQKGAVLYGENFFQKIKETA